MNDWPTRLARSFVAQHGRQGAVNKLNYYLEGNRTPLVKDVKLIKELLKIIRDNKHL